MQEQQLMNQMIALSQKKLELLKDLKRLSEKQNQAFKDKELDEIENLLNKKDEIIEYVQKLDDAFLNVSENLKQQLGIQDLEALSETTLDGKLALKELISEITGVVELIIQLEQDSYGKATDMKDELGDKIKGVNSGKKITSAYSIKPTSSPSYFFDKKK
ncbi:MAG: flagellar biosynthesis protein FlgN [Ruminiclostridium sp.]|nr:flagellar biosynthesis protein FlgN [Ruminiclostridium sp.]